MRLFQFSKSLILQLIKLKLRILTWFTQEHTGSGYQSLHTNSSLSITSPFGLSAIPHCLSEKEEQRFAWGLMVLFQFPSLLGAECPYHTKGCLSLWFPLWTRMRSAFFHYKKQLSFIYLKQSKYLSDPCTGFWQNTKAQEFVTLKSPFLWLPRYTPNWGLSNFSSKLAPCQGPPDSGWRGVKCTMEGSISFYCF